jgi:hypothetical protein
MSDDLNLGKCCVCEREGPSVRNVMMLDRRSPVEGPGCWGCFQCGLPTAGAVAALCDECLARKLTPKFACVGPPENNQRVPIDSLEPFEHDMSKHFRDLPPWDVCDEEDSEL